MKTITTISSAAALLVGTTISANANVIDTTIASLFEQGYGFFEISRNLDGTADIEALGPQGKLEIKIDAEGNIIDQEEDFEDEDNNGVDDDYSEELDDYLSEDEDDDDGDEIEDDDADEIEDEDADEIEDEDADEIEDEDDDADEVEDEDDDADEGEDDASEGV